LAVAHAVQDAAPKSEYVLFAHVGHVFPDLYEPATHLSTVHRLLILLSVPHDGVAHDDRFVIPEQLVHALADVAPAVLVLPAPHAVHALAPAVLYDPATHCVWVVASAGEKYPAVVVVQI
jgi:hypothetical protein